MRPGKSGESFAARGDNMGRYKALYDPPIEESVKHCSCGGNISLTMNISFSDKGDVINEWECTSCWKTYTEQGPINNGHIGRYADVDLPRNRPQTLPIRPTTTVSIQGDSHLGAMLSRTNPYYGIFPPSPQYYDTTIPGTGEIRFTHSSEGDSICEIFNGSYWVEHNIPDIIEPADIQVPTMEEAADRLRQACLETQVSADELAEALSIPVRDSLNYMNTFMNTHRSISGNRYDELHSRSDRLFDVIPLGFLVLTIIIGATVILSALGGL